MPKPAEIPQTARPKHTALGAHIRGLVDERGISTKHLCALIPMDRSSVYQIYAGGRLPTPAFLNALVTVLRLSAEESRALYSAYRQARDGAWVTACNDAMRQFLSGLWSTQVEDAAATLPTPPQTPVEDEVRTLSSRHILQAAALELVRQSLLTEDSPHLQLYVTGESIDIVTELLLMCAAECRALHRPRPLIDQILVLDPSTKLNEQLNAADYLRPFSAAASLYSHDELDYHPRLLYMPKVCAPLIDTIYTCCIIAPNACLLCTEDFQRGLYIRSAAAAQQQRVMFAGSAAAAIDMLAESSGLVQALHSFTSELEDYAGIQLRFSHTPPLFYGYTPELIDKYVPASMPGREVFIGKATQYYLRSGLFSQDDLLFFSQSGLERFVRTGTLDDLPPDIILAIEPQDRYRMMRNVLERMQRGEIRLCMLNDRFPTPTPYYTLYSDEKRLWLTDQRFRRQSDWLNIADPLMLRLFREFCFRLPGSEYVYSDEEMLTQWQSAMGTLLAMG